MIVCRERRGRAGRGNYSEASAVRLACDRYRVVGVATGLAEQNLPGLTLAASPQKSSSSTPTIVQNSSG